jgi:hypothetical protein
MQSSDFDEAHGNHSNQVTLNEKNSMMLKPNTHLVFHHSDAWGSITFT